MYIAVFRPLSESLPVEEKQDPKRTPEGDQAHVGHDGWQVATGNDPWCDEFRESVAPDILVDGDADEHAARDGFVAVHSVGGCNGGESGNLDTSAGVADNDDDLRGTR